MLQDRPTRPAFSVPPGLIGRWQYVDPQGRVSIIEYGDDGYYYAVQPFLPLAFGPGETTMTWGNNSYTRVYGSGATVVGVWRDTTSTDEYYFRADGTFTLAIPGEVDLFGTYRVQADALETSEARASYTVDGSDLVFDVFFGGIFRQSFVLAGDTLTLDGQFVLTRLPALIYKIFRAAEWAALRQNGTTTGAPIDVTDGYIHFSTATQAAETAAKHFAGQDDLFLIAVETAPLGDDLKWEVSRGGAHFPHLYREMRIADVHWAQPLPLEGGVHQFPAGAGFA